MTKVPIQQIKKTSVKLYDFQGNVYLYIINVAEDVYQIINRDGPRKAEETLERVHPTAYKTCLDLNYRYVINNYTENSVEIVGELQLIKMVTEALENPLILANLSPFHTSTLSGLKEGSDACLQFRNYIIQNHLPWTFQCDKNNLLFWQTFVDNYFAEFAQDEPE